MSRKRCYVYLVRHESGKLTGTVLRRDETFCDPPAPQALGDDEQQVISGLDLALDEAVVERREPLERFLWHEELSYRQVTLTVHPQSLVDKRVVVGARTIPLRLGYVACPLRDGGYRIMLPRFGWWMVVESLDSAAEVLKTAVAGALLGESARTLYDFRFEQHETLRAWSPSLTRQARRVSRERSDDDDFEVTSRVADEWVEAAAQRKLARVIGQEDVRAAEDGGIGTLQRLLELSATDPPRSLLLVGPRGSGKSALLRRLAFALARARKSGDIVPRIWRTSAERLVAGMRYLGMLEQQLFDLLDELRYEGDYLYVERLGPLVAAQAGGASLGELMQQSIIDREISFIGECDAVELEHCRRRLPRLINALEIVSVAPRKAEQMVEPFLRYAEQQLPSSQFSSGSVRRLLHYLDAFARDRAFPGKVFNLIDWLATQGLDPGEVAERDATALYCLYSGLPARLVDDEARLPLQAVEAELSSALVGQPAACTAAAAAVVRFKARVNDPERPLGSLLFVGPTGVGKTELAKQLCRMMFGNEAPLVRLDMSEYFGPTSVDRFLAPGRNSVAQRLRESPLSVVLLDEIEKADSRLFDVLLGALDAGRLTDLSGRLVDLRSALIVMTSNLGATDRAPMGFGEQPVAGYTQAVRQFFRPEFVARIDAVVPFAPLGAAALRQIVELELNKIRNRPGLLRRAITLELETSACELLVERGYHPLRGARRLKRVIEELVVAPLAALLAERPGLEHCRVLYRRRGDQLDLALEEGSRTRR
jgi:ATP-dependent Clp protease ATP-binding subunit ClpC